MPEPVSLTFGEFPEDFRERVPRKYPMELNPTDLRTVVKALVESGFQGDENALSLAGGIMSTLDVEWI